MNFLSPRRRDASSAAKPRRKRSSPRAWTALRNATNRCAPGRTSIPAALGTQTGGSVIRPAAYCGAFAIKPTFGAINRAGTKMLSEALDTIGIMARSADDLGLCMQVLAGRTPAAEPTRAPRIGFCKTPRWSLADGATQSHVQNVGRVLAMAGAQVRDFELPAGSDQRFD